MKNCKLSLLNLFHWFERNIKDKYFFRLYNNIRMDGKNSKNTATKNNVLNVEENYNVNGFATMSAKKAYAVRYDDKILVTDSLGKKKPLHLLQRGQLVG